MKFDKAATATPIDQGRTIGKPTPRIDGPFKTTGTAPYAYERNDVAPNAAYGQGVTSGVAKGRIGASDIAAARSAPGDFAVVTWQNAGKLAQAKTHYSRMLAGPEI